METVDLSVVVPVYRSANTLETLATELRAALDRSKLTYEIVFVEDASPDNSWEVLTKLQALFPDRIVAIQLMRNYGQHNALMCGFRRASGRRYILTMDDDLQNPPAETIRLINAICDSDLDLVYGIYGVKSHSRWRNLGTRTSQLFFRIVFSVHVRTTSFNHAA